MHPDAQIMLYDKDISLFYSLNILDILDILIPKAN